jgi:unsaturated chondroitin disaccharide hydrolase
MIYHLPWTSHAVPEHLEYFARHHEATLAAGLIRPDGSTAHAAILNDQGKVDHYETLQGYNAESTWARGQSWAMHNFRVAAETTGRPQFSEASERMNRWWLSRLPDDPVPFYDFQDPDRELRPRDPDAAAMATSMFMRVNEDPRTTSPELQSTIDRTLTELCRNYVTLGGVMIHGSLGKVEPIFYGMETTRRPPGHNNPKAVIARFPQEEVMVYGNYFIVETLHRRLSGEADFPKFLASAQFR